MTDDEKLLASLKDFTPGPWLRKELIHEDRTGIEYLSGVEVSTVRGFVVHNHELGFNNDVDVQISANAVLIAAAPDLFRIATEQATKIEAQAKEISALRIERGHVNDALQDMCDKMARALGDPV